MGYGDLKEISSILSHLPCPMLSCMLLLVTSTNTTCPGYRLTIYFYVIISFVSIHQGTVIYPLMPQIIIQLIRTTTSTHLIINQLSPMHFPPCTKRRHKMHSDEVTWK